MVDDDYAAFEEVRHYLVAGILPGSGLASGRSAMLLRRRFRTIGPADIDELRNLSSFGFAVHFSLCLVNFQLLLKRRRLCRSFLREGMVGSVGGCQEAVGTFEQCTGRGPVAEIAHDKT